eukprot:16438947-Heterocapsa_arctica.AAC.1
MSLGESFLRSYLLPSMIQENGPSSSYPSSERTATTTATGPLACFPLPLLGFPFVSFLVTSCFHTPSRPSTAV